VLIDGGGGLRLLLDRIRRTSSQASALGHPLAGWADALAAAAQRVEHTTVSLWKDGDPGAALTNATVYLEAVGHVVLAWIWLEQAVAAQARPAISMTVSALPRNTSSTTNSLRRPRSSTCSIAATEPPSI
jgi:butyryl-CoA dehydrogenase